MSHRIQVEDGGGVVCIRFEGVLDGAALAEIVAMACAARGRTPTREIALALERGTQVDAGCVEGLRRLEGVRVTATAPFLARWLAGAS